MKEQSIIQLINQLVEIREKIAAEKTDHRFGRNLDRIFSVLEAEGFIWRNPLGEKYTASRTDCEASIVGRESQNMVITRVIKPSIYKKGVDGVTIVQKAVVLVEKS